MSLFRVELPPDSSWKFPWLIPQSHAEICPVCKGNGKIMLPPNPNVISASGDYTVCHGCGGLGWVMIK